MRKHGNRGRRASAKAVRAQQRKKQNEPKKSVAPAGRKQAAKRKPHYDRKRCELRVGEVVVKRISQRSDAQEVILLAFQEQNWHRDIDDPLTGKVGQDPQRRLSTAVANLNRRQRVDLIWFRVNQHGTGVTWQFREASDSKATVERQ